MDVFAHQEYRKILKEKIAEAGTPRGYQSKLASAAGCQTSYLSRVLNGTLHLTPEHAAGLCRFWNFDEKQSQYFLELVHLERAGTEELRKVVRKSLAAIRARQKEIDAAVKLPSLQNLQKQAKYYSKWHYAAVHMLVSIKEYSTVNKVAERLQISVEVASRVIADLESMQIIEKRGPWYVSEDPKIHLPRSSPLLYSHLTNWHLLALEDVNAGLGDSVHYAAVHSLARKDISRIQDMIREFIKKAQEVVNESPEEDLACFICDFFTV
ncbi:MAG: TIGR02147 family protein [Oligoflexales bacterium]